MPKWLPVAILIFSFVGLADAGYLAFEHFHGSTPNCSILEGCDTVTTSEYSYILGIPVSYMGTFYYFSMTVLMVAWLDRRKAAILRLASWYSVTGFLFSAWFVYVQLGILDAICIYCMGSAATSTIIFILGMLMLHKYKRITCSEPTSPSTEPSQTPKTPPSP